MRILKLFIATIALVLSACGGGGGGCSATSFGFGSWVGQICQNNQSNSISPTISGLAVGGAPILGFVEITDSLGIERSTPIRIDGSYTVDVGGMNGPFILKATGTIGGTSVVYYSAGTNADIGGVINITPFTDLILSNIHGDLIGVHLSDKSNTAKLAARITEDKIRTTQELLSQKLKPILNQLGLIDNIDLIRKSFSINDSGLGVLLKLVGVEYSSNSPEIILRNIITQAEIVSIDVTQTISTNTIQISTISDINTSSAATIAVINQLLTKFERLFTGGMPTINDLVNSEIFYTSELFLFEGKSFQQFAEDLVSDPKLVGASFKSWSLVEFKPNVSVTIDLSFYYTLSGGRFQNHATLVFVYSGGVWRISGNQRTAKINIRNEHILKIKTNTQFSYISEPILRSGIGFDIDTYYNNMRFTPISSVEIKGGGINGTIILTADPDNLYRMKINQPALADNYLLWDCNSAIGIEAYLPCLNWSNMRPSVPYQIILKNSFGESLNGAGYKVRINSLPLAFNKISQNLFVKIISAKINDLPLSSATFHPMMINKNMQLDFRIPADLQIHNVSMSLLQCFSGEESVVLQKNYSVPLGSKSAVFSFADESIGAGVSKVRFKIVAITESDLKFVTENDVVLQDCIEIIPQ